MPALRHLERPGRQFAPGLGAAHLERGREPGRGPGRQDRRTVAEAAGDLLGRRPQHLRRLGQPLRREPVGGPGGGDGRDHRALGAAHRGGERDQPLLELLDRLGPAALARLVQLPLESGRIGEGARGEGLELAAQQLAALGRLQVRQQHLPARGRMQHGPVAHPVVHRHGAAGLGLVEVHRDAAAQHRDVDGLPELLGERLADRARDRGEVPARPGGGGQAQQTHAQLHGAVVPSLDEVVPLEGGDQARGGGGMDLQLTGDRRHARPVLARDRLEHLHRPVHGLHRPAYRRAPLRHRSLGHPSLRPPPRRRVRGPVPRPLRRRQSDDTALVAHCARHCAHCTRVPE